MRIEVPHHTTKDNARRMVEQRLATLLGQFSQHAEDLQHDWFGDTLEFKGKARGLKVEGTVEVTDAAILIHSRLPLIAMPFEHRIRETIEREAETMFRMA
jgi:hypothetical protein